MTKESLDSALGAHSPTAGEKLPRDSAQSRDSAGPSSPLTPWELARLSCVGICVLTYKLAALDCFMSFLCHIFTCVSQKKGFALTHSWQLPNSSTE